MARFRSARAPVCSVISHEERRQQLTKLLLDFRACWHPQPFREPQPAWVLSRPALAADLLALPDAVVEYLNEDGHAARRFLQPYLPEIAAFDTLIGLSPMPVREMALPGAFWDWEIPGRKRAQIEAFGAACQPPAEGGEVLDWCSGKGHLGRLLALAWQVPVSSLEIDPALCCHGNSLARRAGARQAFVQADALQVTDWPLSGQHAVALHACGELHRRLIRLGAAAGVAAFDVAPCCYYRGVTKDYPSMVPSDLSLSHDDVRLAVTETVTASTRERRWRDQSLAWKLGFDAYRRTLGAVDYRTFKPVPERFLRASFADFMAYMTQREGLPPLASGLVGDFEALGRQRRQEVMRYSILRHAFRRPLEVWLALDLVIFLEKQGYEVGLGEFCSRVLTPRNLLISART